MRYSVAVTSSARRKIAFSRILISDAVALEAPISAHAATNVAEASAKVNNALAGFSAAD
jgi:hypothetical protein